MANKSDFTKMVEKIKTTKLLFMDYFCSQLYTKFSIPISNVLDLEQLFSTIKDTMVPNNSNFYTLIADWTELEEDKANLVIINGQKFKSHTTANKYINTLDHGPKRLQR